MINIYSQIFGLWLPMITSVIIIALDRNAFFMALKNLRVFLVLTIIVNGVYFIYQENTGWDNARGVHLIPVVSCSIFYFLKEKNPLVELSPLTGYAVQWISLFIMDLVGGYLFNISEKVGLMKNKIEIGGAGIADALFIFPLGFSMLIIGLPILFKYGNKIGFLGRPLTSSRSKEK